MSQSEEGEPTSLASFQALIKEWDEQHVAPSYDSTQILHQMAEILEKETNVYNASDPDPFEERHPSRVDSDCQLGLVLKSYFKKESLVSEVFSNYLKENYWTRMGVNKSSFDLNVASCRLVLDIMPGLETGVISDTDGLVTQLYKWTESAEEPLRSYATGLLAVAMELTDVATEPDIREKNTRLVPEMLRRLTELQKQQVDERDQARSERFKRPFALFAKSPIKNPRRASKDNDEEMPKAEIITSSGESTAKPKEPQAPAMERSGSTGRLTPGWPCGMMSPPRGGTVSTENSNSSWAEMELNVIGHYGIYPLTPQASQIFMLRLLTPLAEYQEFLSFIHEWKILDVLKRYINVRETRDSRLAFEALKLLASLLLECSHDTAASDNL